MLNVRNLTRSPLMVGGRPVAPGKSTTIEKLDPTAEFLQRNNAIEVTRIVEVPKPKPKPAPAKVAEVPAKPVSRTPPIYQSAEPVRRSARHKEG